MQPQLAQCSSRRSLRHWSLLWSPPAAAVVRTFGLACRNFALSRSSRLTGTWCRRSALIHAAQSEDRYARPTRWLCLARQPHRLSCQPPSYPSPRPAIWSVCWLVQSRCLGPCGLTCLFLLWLLYRLRLHLLVLLTVRYNLAGLVPTKAGRFTLRDSCVRCIPPVVGRSSDAGQISTHDVVSIHAG